MIVRIINSTSCPRESRGGASLRRLRNSIQEIVEGLFVMRSKCRHTTV